MSKLKEEKKTSYEYKIIYLFFQKVLTLLQQYLQQPLLPPLPLPPQHFLPLQKNKTLVWQMFVEDDMLIRTHSKKIRREELLNEQTENICI